MRFWQQPAFPSSSIYLEGTPENPAGADYNTDKLALRSKVEAFGPGGALARPGGPVISLGFVAGETEGPEEAPA